MQGAEVIEMAENLPSELFAKSSEKLKILIIYRIH